MEKVAAISLLSALSMPARGMSLRAIQILVGTSPQARIKQWGATLQAAKISLPG
jgi:hypothetical protein